MHISKIQHLFLLKEHFDNIMDIVLYPSEEGQIRTKEKRDQAIDLYIYDLETTEFAPPSSKSLKTN